jgi:FtsH-binding integral membrane protein
MSNPNADETELLLRVNRRSLAILLAVILIIGAAFISAVLQPDGLPARIITHMPWMLPALLAGAALILQIPLKGKRWTPQAPEVRAVLDDEFRRTNLGRAQRTALVVVLLVQFPLGLLLMRLPAAHVAMVMAGATITIGLAVAIAAFLFFDREPS